MTKLVIEILDRDGSYLAIACRDGQLLSRASVGGGSSEREAVIQAANAYYNYQALIDSANNPPTFIAPEVEKATDGARTARVAIHLAGIDTLLREAVENGDAVLISGTKVGGQPYNRRKVSPVRVESVKRVYGGEVDYLVCRDENAGDMRTFRLDGISRAEVA